MRFVVSFIAFLLIGSFSVVAQELEQYEIEGAKLGKKNSKTSCAKFYRKNSCNK